MTPRLFPLVAFAIAFILRTPTTRADGLPETPPDFEWAVQAGGAGHDKTRGLALDDAGNIYMTGEFAQTAVFGDFTVTSKGELDFFVAKYSPEGKCLWVRTGGGGKIDRGYGVAVDAQGNVFATGHCQSTDATFDGTTMPNHGDYDIFVVKYDAKGKLLWLKSGGGAGYDYGHSIAVTNAGDCFVTGAMAGDCEFAGKSVSNGKGGHVFLARFSSAGELAWLRVSEGGGSAGEHLALDADGGTVVVGGASGSATFGKFTIGNKSGREAFAVKHDAAGNELWSFKGDGSVNALFSSVALDARGDVCLTGMFQGTLALGGRTVESLGANDLLVAKLDRDGKLRWFRTGGGAGVDYALSVAADAEGNVYATGEFTGSSTIGDAKLAGIGVRDLYVAKFDDAGGLRWVKTAGGSRGSLGYCIVRSRVGAIFVSGAFDGSATYGKASLTSKGSNDIMLLKLGK